MHKPRSSGQRADHTVKSPLRWSSLRDLAVGCLAACTLQGLLTQHRFVRHQGGRCRWQSSFAPPSFLACYNTKLCNGFRDELSL